MTESNSNQRKLFILYYYRPDRTCRLRQTSYDPYRSIAVSLDNYNLGRISFVNVFTGSEFAYRAYVRNNQVVPLRASEFSFDRDPHLHDDLVSSTPLLGLTKLMQLADLNRGVLLDSYSVRPLVYHTSQKSNHAQP